MTGPKELRLHTLEEVHQITGLPLRPLQDGARAKPPKFEHTHFGGRRWMTDEQIEKLIATSKAAPPPPVDPAAADRARVIRMRERETAPKQRRGRSAA